MKRKTSTDTRTAPVVLDKYLPTINVRTSKHNSDFTVEETSISVSDNNLNKAYEIFKRIKGDHKE